MAERQRRPGEEDPPGLLSVHCASLVIKDGTGQTWRFFAPVALPRLEGQKYETVSGTEENLTIITRLYSSDEGRCPKVCDVLT